MHAISGRFLTMVATLLLAGASESAQAQFAVGTWVPKSGPMVGIITMKVEMCCGNGRRFTYYFKGNPASTMTIESPLDGSEVPVFVGGKPSGETMATQRVDARHTVTVVKMDGKAFGTSRAELSVDGNTVTVENTTAGYAGQKPTKTTEIWVKQ
jgi:hypothetical protein